MRSAILIAAVLAATAASAQHKGYQGNLGGTIGMGIPQGEFADTWAKDMFTWGGHVTLPAQRLPFQWGFAFGYGTMGSLKSKVPVAVPELMATEGDLAVKARVLSYHALLRFSPSKGKVRPYVEGLAGGRQFTTLSTITVDGLHQPVSRERSANDFALSTGWAAGLMVGLGSFGYIEARTERFYSGNASYVDPASIAVDQQGAVSFSTLESATGTLNLLVGMGFRF